MVPAQTRISGLGTGQSLPRLVSKCQTRGKGACPLLSVLELQLTRIERKFLSLQFGTIEGISRWRHRNRFAGELDGARHWLVVGMVRAIQAQLRACTDTQGPRCSACSWTDQNYGNWKPMFKIERNSIL